MWYLWVLVLLMVEIWLFQAAWQVFLVLLDQEQQGNTLFEGPQNTTVNTVRIYANTRHMGSTWWPQKLQQAIYI